MLDEWTAALARELGVPVDNDSNIDIAIVLDTVLDVARDAAHNVVRPAAPITTFLVGYAAASQGGGQGAIVAASAKATALAFGWNDSHTAGK